MQFIVKQHLFAYEFINPPADDRQFNIDLRITNSSGSLQLTKEATGFQTIYLLGILKPTEIGFTTTESSVLNRDLRNLVLALNLALSRIVFVTTKSEFAKVNTEFQPIEPWQTVEQNENQTVVHLHEYVAISDSVSIMVGTSEDVNEDLVIKTFQKIQSMKRFDIQANSPVTTVNLSKAFSEYENSITSFDRLVMFKHLFNTIELSTNWDGKSRESDELDKEIAQLSGIQQSDAKAWREFYNRTKHVDMTTSDVTTTIQGMENLPSLLGPVRECARKIIFDRLQI
jgi:hypothetical protein